MTENLIEENSSELQRAILEEKPYRLDTLGELSLNWFLTDRSDNTIRINLKKHNRFGL